MLPNAAVDPNLIISLEGKLEFSVLSGKNLGKGNIYCKFGFTNENGHFVREKFHKTKHKNGTMTPEWKSKDKNSKEFIIQEPTEMSFHQSPHSSPSSHSPSWGDKFQHKKFKVEVWDVLSDELLALGFIFFKEFQEQNEHTREIVLKPRYHKNSNTEQPNLKVYWKFTPKNSNLNK